MTHAAAKRTPRQAIEIAVYQPSRPLTDRPGRICSGGGDGGTPCGASPRRCVVATGRRQEAAPSGAPAASLRRCEVGEAAQPVRETRWVATVALVLAIVGVLLGGYAALLARGNASTIEELGKTEAARIEKPMPAKAPAKPE